MAIAASIRVGAEHEKGAHPPTPDSAGEGRTVGASSLGFEREMSGVKFLAEASRFVSGWISYRASNVARIDVWS